MDWIHLTVGRAHWRIFREGCGALGPIRGNVLRFLLRVSNYAFILRVHLAQNVTFITFVKLHILSTNSLICFQTLMLPCLGAESQEVHTPFSLFAGEKRTEPRRDQTLLPTLLPTVSSRHQHIPLSTISILSFRLRLGLKSLFPSHKSITVFKTLLR